MSRTDAGLLALKGHAAGGAAVAGDELVRCGRGVR